MNLLNDISFTIQIPKIFKGLFEPKRYKVFYGGRGGAKSWGFAQALLVLGLQNKLRILCARELQKSINDSVHKLLSDQVVSLGLSEFYEVQKTTIRGVNGTEFLFNGLKHNATEIKSTEGIDIAWVEEAEKVSDASWELLIPTIRKENSEIWISFNTKQPTDATYKRFVYANDDDVYVQKVSFRDNPFFPEVLEKERLKLLKNDPEAYQHIWEGNFDTRFSGAVYAKWVADLKEKGRISHKVQHDADYPVSTLWDLGYSDTNAIWFYQEAPNEVLLIDYYQSHNEGIGHYCEMLKAKPYKYKSHYVPQDAGKKLMEANGRSIVEQALKDYGVRMTIIPETTHANRHEGLRKVLPFCWFNEDNCAEGLDALMAYHYEYNDDLQIFKKDPVHDWSSHACLVGSTMVISSRGLLRLDELPFTGRVLTPCGYVPYHSPRITRKNAPLVEVVFKDGLSVKCTQEHLFLTTRGWRYAKHLTPYSEILSTLTKSPNILMEDYIGYGQVRSIFLVAAKSFIEMCGEVLSEKYQQIVISTIKIEILKITRSIILNAYPRGSILHLLGNRMRKFIESVGLAKKPMQVEINGMNQLKVNCKAKEILKERKNGQNGQELITLASIAEQYSKPLEEKVVIPKNIAPKNVDLLAIVSVKKLKEKSDVWCLTVPNVESFSLANGAAVHNSCALELLPSAWRGKSITIEQMRKRDMDNSFHRKRREHNLVKQDPYRIKPMLKKH